MTRAWNRRAYRMGARPTRRRRRQERRYAAESRSLTQCFTSGFATLATCLRFCPPRVEAVDFAAAEAVATAARDEDTLRKRRARSGVAEQLAAKCGGGGGGRASISIAVDRAGAVVWACGELRL